MQSMTDKQLRPLIRCQLAQEFRGSALIEELPLQRIKKADLAIVNDCLRGYEIKSDHDRLNRLPEQIPFYDAVFDFCSIIAAPRFVKKATSLAGPHWGIFVIQPTGEIQNLRPATQNPFVQVQAICQLLWKPEAIRLLRQYGNPLPAKSCVKKVWRELEHIPYESLSAYIRSTITGRKVTEGHALL